MSLLSVKRNSDGNVVYPDTRKTPTASCARPNDTNAYAIGDVVGTIAASNLIFEGISKIPGGKVIINRVELEVDVASIPTGMGAFRLYLYNSAPTAIADNAAYNLPAADRAKCLGRILIDKPEDLGDTLYIQMDGVNFQCMLASGSTTLYGMLVTDAAYTPTALVVKKVTIHPLEV